MSDPALPEAVAAFKALQQELSAQAQTRQQLMQQINETEMVKEELDRLDEDATVFKQIGPALIKQDLVEAKANVCKRLEFIQGELKRVNDKQASIESRAREQQAKVMELQQKQAAAAAAAGVPAASSPGRTRRSEAARRAARGAAAAAAAGAGGDSGRRGRSGRRPRARWAQQLGSMADDGAPGLLTLQASSKPKKKKARPDDYLKQVSDKKLKGKLKHTERLYKEANKAAARLNTWLAPAEAGLLEAEGVEETWQIQQAQIASAVQSGAARKAFDLALPDLGPYSLAYSRAGRHMVLGGAKGHLAVLEWGRGHLTCELQVKETTRAVTFLHNELFFAAAQAKYVYIYDKRGLEVHALRGHVAPAALDFLPHHFLLTSIGEQGVLHYQDTSTGQIVAEHRTRLGPCDVMRHNPHNAVIACGHAAGSVTMWTPNITTPVVKMLCHRGAVRALAVDPTGHQLVTAGVDCQVKVWDVRTYKPLHAYFANAPPTSLDVSQRGLLAVAQGARVQVWRDALGAKAAAPYLNHLAPLGAVRAARFCPYEDVLGLGCAGGVSSALVPGAGEPNFDSYVANPYASARERREAEVAALLDKLQPDTIMLEPEAVGKVLKEPADVAASRRAAEAAANAARVAAARRAADNKARMKGRNKPTRRQKKKQLNIIEDRKPALRAKLQEEERERKEVAQDEKRRKLETVPRALHRLYH
ncbi:utp7 [Scenedesmus sp. PABB004]|nr:utp7 [Scenedesmus sp. PABB004]